AGLAFTWWSRERHARNAEAVAGLLDQCEQALRGEDLARATVALEAAQKRAAEGGAEGAATRRGGPRAGPARLAGPGVIDLFRWTPVNNNFPENAAVAARYHEALGPFGADPDVVSPEEAAARASGSVLRSRITAAWDRLLLEEKADRARAALRILDADP